MLGTVVNIILAAFAVSLIIVVHEFGHFVFAKLIGVRVEVFSIGFWKRIVGFRIGDTDYRLSLVPLGGYVRVAGESAHGGTGEPNELPSKTVGQRALFVVGGVLMNVVLAVVLFIVAFAVGVPLAVAEVGQTEPGGPAWQAGLQPGDQIVAVGRVQDPVFKDILRAVALGGQDTVRLKVRRQNELLSFEVQPRYDPWLGHRVVGILPPAEPVVTGLVKTRGGEGRCPAREAGVEIGDRILAINGQRIRSARDVRLELVRYPTDEVELLLERDGERLTVTALPELRRHYMIGISGISSTVSMLGGPGLAEQLGLQVGDTITAVNGQPVQSLVAIERAMRRSLGEVSLDVARGERQLTFTLDVPDVLVLERFLGSVVFDGSARLTWVSEDSPAWQAGMRPGDTVRSVAGTDVGGWDDIAIALAGVAPKRHEISWSRDGELLTTQVEAVPDASVSSGHLGIAMDWPKTVRKRYGAAGAIRWGFVNTFETLGEILLFLKGVATRQVSPRTVGGIVTIAYYAYQAARLGIPRLLHLTAMLSAAIGFMNILPIPVLDGGHLVLLAIEKVRGRRLGERVVGIAQSVGLAFLLLLVVYVTWNDVMRLLRLR